MTDIEIEKHIRDLYSDSEEKLYNIGTDEFVCYTDKETFIKFKIDLRKELYKSVGLLK
jgi:hypothetical protein